MFKSIVVAFDGSAHASKALEIGAGLAAKDKIPLGIIYVVDSAHSSIPDDLRRVGEIEHVIDQAPRMLVNLENAPGTIMSSLSRASVESERAMFEYADFLVDQASRMAREYGAEDIKTTVELGSPADAIIAFATERGADLIITGCRGFSKLKGLLLGSTSSKINRHAACSCLTVK